MAERVRAPWSDEQVSAINRYQTQGVFHPFTCRNCRDGELVAARDGLNCPKCQDSYQDWCFDFMASWKEESPVWPQSSST